MAVLRLADLPAWAMKVQRVADAVVSQATADVLAGIEVVPGLARGGSRVPGTIPRDLGALAASLQSSLYGSTSLSVSGANSYVLAAGSMKAGDVARFAWGGPAAPYARAVHDGAKGVPGTHWIDAAANRWPAAVARAVAKAKAEIMA